MEPVQGTSPRDEGSQKAPRKRKRIVISCTECHRRKQKCDRASPCSNCVTRKKESLCHYENESARKAQLLEESVAKTSDGGGIYATKLPESDSAEEISKFGYAKNGNNNNTTLAIFKKIENYDTDASSIIPHQAVHSSDYSGLREKYKNLIRQLPAKPFIEKLLATYFKEVNYQYYPLDEAIFRDHLKSWNNLSFSTLNKGPTELPPDLQFFPALLFQTLALALQFQPPDYDSSLDSLKYAAAMSLDDLASDYSESGCQIMCLLGKRNTTLVTVQAGFLRTSFMKNCGMVPESWHFLSQTIRDAQEIGLHKDHIEHRRKPDEKPEDFLEHLWLEQLRRRMWMILSMWDVHMGIVLGRPTTIDTRDGMPKFPIDAPIPKNRREEAPSPRTELDPPTPLTAVLWMTEICAPLWDIFNLEKEDPRQNNIAKVEKMHKLINQITMHCPPFFRSKNPDTTFDSRRDCFWLPRYRATFQSNTAFSIMALHRPYIFTNPHSRTTALQAGLDVLRAQRTFFNLLNVNHYKMFSLVLNTFDAVILVAAIYILHPNENASDLDDTLQHFEWAMERFHTMSNRNSMANGALGVLKAIHVRLKCVPAQARSSPGIRTLPTLTTSSTSTSNLTPPSSTDSPSTLNPNIHPKLESTYNPYSAPSTTSTSSLSNASSNPSPQYTLPTISNLTEATPAPTPVSATASGWDGFPSTGSGLTPSGFDFSAIAPMHPLHDLLYNDLNTVSDGGANGGGLDLNDMSAGAGAWDGIDAAGMEVGRGNGMQQWQFEGDFSNDSFWGFMNNYNP